MLTEKQLQAYAELVVTQGVNLQPNQDLMITCPPECVDFARALAKEAYRKGAFRVSINYQDDVLTRIRLDEAQDAAMEDVLPWVTDMRNNLVDRGGAHISISAKDPNVFRGADVSKLQRLSRANQMASQKYFEAITSNKIRWCVISVPTERWAETVFPQCSTEEAVSRLGDAIAHSVRLDTEDPMEALARHNERLHALADKLNRLNFHALHYTNAKGTDLTVGLAQDHVWIGGSEPAADGIEFNANLPSEEIFTAPDKNRVDGIVYSALPLVHGGSVIDQFWIRFQDGRVVDYGAEKGYDSLKMIIETDEGSHRLGEAALIGKRSPIHEMGILFYNTLFDENASCHLALGDAYTTNVKNSETLSKEELSAKGLNSSMEHCDFMIGTDDLNIDGILQDGSVVPVFRNGDWVL